MKSRPLSEVRRDSLRAVSRSFFFCLAFLKIQSYCVNKVCTTVWTIIINCFNDQLIDIRNFIN